MKRSTRRKIWSWHTCWVCIVTTESYSHNSYKNISPLSLSSIIFTIMVLSSKHHVKHCPGNYPVSWNLNMDLFEQDVHHTNLHYSGVPMLVFGGVLKFLFAIQVTTKQSSHIIAPSSNMAETFVHHGSWWKDATWWARRATSSSSTCICSFTPSSRTITHPGIPHTSGQNIIIYTPGFSWNKGISLLGWGRVRSP